MPDSQQSPTWGSAYDARDLEELLSGAARGLTGEGYGFPEALRPVADALAELAEPARGAAAGEAAARALFRAEFPSAVPALTPPVSVPHRTPVPPRAPVTHYPPVPPLPPAARLPVPPLPSVAHAPAGPPWAGDAEPGTVHSRTLVLPAVGDGSRRAPRHRRGRRGRAGFVRWPAVVTAGAALVAAIVIAVALTGAFPGSLRPAANNRGVPAGPGTSATSTRDPSVLPGVDGQATPVPSVTPTPASPSASAAPRPTVNPAGPICRALAWSYYVNPTPPGVGSYRAGLYARLVALAGSSAKVWGLCYPYLAPYMSRARFGS